MCLQPFEVINPRTKKTYLVPCGKCVDCLQEYQDGISIRLEQELIKYKYIGVFFTLTYSPSQAHAVNYVDKDTGEVLSYDSYSDLSPKGVRYDRHRILDVNVSDVQKWLKRCRRRMERFYGYSRSWSYYITSEYGPKSLRPHYHGLFFGVDELDFNRFFLNDWNNKTLIKRYKKPRKFEYFTRIVPNIHYKGNVKVENIIISDGKNPTAVANYVSKYCSKGQFENPRVAEGIVSKCFHLCSKGLGIDWVYKNKSEILEGYRDAFIECGEGASSVYQFRDYQDFKFHLISKLSYRDPFSLYDLQSEFKVNPFVHDYSFTPVWYESSIRHDKSYILPISEVVLKDYYVRVWPFFSKSLFFRKLKHGYSFHSSIKLYKIPSVRSWYNRIACIPPSLDFCKRVIFKLQKLIVRQTKSGKNYFLKIPRYYYEKLFPQDSPLRKGLQEALQIISDEVRSRKLEQLQALRPSLSPSQMGSFLSVQLEREAQFRASKKIEQFVRFYNKSIL